MAFIICLSVLYCFCLHHVSSLRCNYCEDTLPSEVSQSSLNDFCFKVKGVLSKRCCYSNTSLTGLNDNTTELLGLDLSNCSMVCLPGVNMTIKNSLQWLAINDNPITIDGHKHFQNYLNLKEMISTGNQSCVHSFSNITWIDSNITRCENPVNRCDSDGCPSHSDCTMNGPGAILCHCDKDFKSYRCLKKDGFPTAQWLGGFGGVTIVLCVVLRIFQHKGLKRGKEMKAAKLQ